MTFEKDPDQAEKKQLHQFADFKGKRVLEIGCGEGRLTWRYAGKTALAIGIDTDRDALRVASFDRASDVEDRVHFVHAMSEHLPFTKEKFDIAILAWSL